MFDAPIEADVEVAPQVVVAPATLTAKVSWRVLRDCDVDTAHAFLDTHWLQTAKGGGQGGNTHERGHYVLDADGYWRVKRAERSAVAFLSPGEHRTGENGTVTLELAVPRKLIRPLIPPSSESITRCGSR